LENLPDSEDERQPYWQSIRAAIVEVGCQSRRELTNLLLSGQDANNPTFIDIVRDALREQVPDTRMEAMLHSNTLHDKFDLVYIDTRKAAEFAKRTQESPPNCSEPPRCANDRYGSEILESEDEAEQVFVEEL